jgi:hypothetical protein
LKNRAIVCNTGRFKPGLKVPPTRKQECLRHITHSAVLDNPCNSRELAVLDFAELIL